MFPSASVNIHLISLYQNKRIEYHAFFSDKKKALQSLVTNTARKILAKHWLESMEKILGRKQWEKKKNQWYPTFAPFPSVFYLFKDRFPHLNPICYVFSIRFYVASRATWNKISYCLINKDLH